VDAQGGAVLERATRPMHATGSGHSRMRIARLLLTIATGLIMTAAGVYTTFKSWFA
jgi:hypothetical protein